MAENGEDGLIRRYLLGRLRDDELQQLEEKMMVDNNLFNRVLLAEDEMVEEYVQGELPESDRAEFEASFLSTPEGDRQVTIARALREHVSTASAEAADARKMTPVSQPITSLAAWWKQLTFSPSLRLAASVVIVLGLGFGIWRVYFYQSDVSKGIAVLAYAYREQRPVEVRISGFNYAPARTTRGDEEMVDRVARNRAERILLDAVFEHPGPAAHHALGRLYLAEEKFDDAIAQFDDALKADPNNARLHNDLGAALLEKGKADQLKGASGRSFEEFGQSLEHLNRAIELDASLLEALFNRALCYQSMSLAQRAEEQWQRYLEQDANSRWGDEARQYLKLLEERKAKSSKNRDQLFQHFLEAYQSEDDEKAWKSLSNSRGRTGNVIVEKLLDAYLDSMTQGDSKEATDQIQMLAYAGNVEARKVGDKFTSDLARYCRRTTPDQRNLLTQARRWMKDANHRFNRSEFDQAIKFYSRAKRLFAQASDACEAMSAESCMGLCYLRIPNTQQSLSIFELLSRACEKKGYGWMLAQSLNAISDAQTSVDALSDALVYANRSLVRIPGETGHPFRMKPAMYSGGNRPPIPV